MNAVCDPDAWAINAAATATTVLPLPTSPCSNRFIGRPRAMSAAISSMTRRCARVGSNGSEVKNGSTSETSG